MSKLWLGSAVADITPPDPVPLAGFAHRTGSLEGIRRRLCARVWMLGQEAPGGVVRHRALVVQGDIVWWDDERVAALREQLHAALGIAPACILFNASHTHSGPQTTERFHASIGAMDRSYRAYMERQVLDAAQRAVRTLEPVTIERGVGACPDIGINRRRLSAEGKMEMAPNAEGVNDTEVTVVRFAGVSGQTKGVWFHYTCHPTTTDENWASSEYCGAAMEELDRRLGAGTSCFLQGCCGDVRPALVRDGQFYRGDDGDVQRFGERLAAAVQAILDGSMQQLPPSAVVGAIRSVELPLEGDAGIGAHGRVDVHGGAHERVDVHGGVSAHGRDSSPATLELQWLQIAEGLALLAMNGEMVVEYGLLVKRLFGGAALPLGYSNGMIGYVPTARQIAEGGYEGRDSAPYFGLAAPFAPRVEPLIHEQIEAVAAEAGAQTAATYYNN